ncbi:tectonic-2 isoform X2 [Alosa sapidissima]|uniref:tectonic-2 isoform X2 n=1 Tax=Alosa sapidissima TaxID=34773 RepID=UPI001C08AD56|nr:tectonic-2 isoform X2 [Alosa sapidissima]
MAIELKFWTWSQFLFIITIISKDVNSSTDNKTEIPHQVHQPLGSCPCDLTADICDLRCCCDMDCSFTVSQLFESYCLPGPLGGNASHIPDYQCSNQTSENTPDWFLFLCVTSPAENNPLLGLHYNGKTVAPKGTPSFKNPKLTLPHSATSYRQGRPIITATDEYFTIPQRSLLGQCMENTPVGFLENVQTECIRFPLFCPPLPTNLAEDIRDGHGGLVTIDVTHKLGTDQTPSVSWAPNSQNANNLSESHMVLCENVTLAWNYTFYWRREGLSGITLVRTFGNVFLDHHLPLITKISVTFVNGDIAASSHSGVSGYLVGKHVVGGVMSPSMVIHRAALNLWHSGEHGLCESASMRPVLFGVNSTSGCMFPVSLDNFTECSRLRDAVQTMLTSLVTSTLIARNGNPNFYSLADWVNVTSVVHNSRTIISPAFPGLCEGVPSQLHVVIYCSGGLQTEITAVKIHLKPTTWRLQCETGTYCQDLNTTQYFPLTSTITFSEELSLSTPPKTRFQITFTEFDCARNDVCWPELTFPLTRYYTGEPSSQALVKAIYLIFLFIIASLLGSPWTQIRQALSNTEL